MTFCRDCPHCRGQGETAHGDPLDPQHAWTELCQWCAGLGWVSEETAEAYEERTAD